MSAGRWRASVQGVLAAVVLSAGLVGVGAVAAQAAGCVSSPVTDPISVVVTPDTAVTSWDFVELAFSGSIADGHCGGDSFTIALPPQLRGQEGESYPMLDPETDEPVAMMVVQDGQLVVTLTDYVESHQNVSVEGFVDVRVDGSFEPGEVWELTWTVNGQASTTPIEFAECPNCEVPNPNASKYAQYAGGVVIAYIATAPAVQAGQEFTFTDTVGPNQSIQCPASVPGTVMGNRWTSLNVWGEPANPVEVPMTVSACSATSITASVTSTAAGQVFQLRIKADAMGTGPWTDEGTVVTQGETEPVDAVAYRYGGGGSGSGDASTPTPTPTVTQSPSVTPTPTVSESPSATPTVSESPSVTPSVERSTPPSVTPAPSRTPVAPTLAQTGVELTSIAAWGAALLVGGFLLVVGSRTASRTATRRH